ncbi:hypothetical protein HY004_01570, partial [Candidatus Saccharibacteria bacterium]|nr:hypothetical protein [Candidatus Saccharibacteria bacterium]
LVKKWTPRAAPNEWCCPGRSAFVIQLSGMTVDPPESGSTKLCAPASARGGLCGVRGDRVGAAVRGVRGGAHQRL